MKKLRMSLLYKDALVSIFLHLDGKSLFEVVPYVCKGWLRARKDMRIYTKMDRMLGISTHPNLVPVTRLAENAWMQMLYIKEWIIKEIAKMRTFGTFPVDSQGAQMNFGNISLLDFSCKGIYILALHGRNRRNWTISVRQFADLLKQQEHNRDKLNVMHFQEIMDTMGRLRAQSQDNYMHALNYMLRVVMIILKYQAAQERVCYLGDGVLKLMTTSCNPNDCVICAPTAYSESVPREKRGAPFIVTKDTYPPLKAPSHWMQACQKCIWKAARWSLVFELMPPECSCGVKVAKRKRYFAPQGAPHGYIPNDIYANIVGDDKVESPVYEIVCIDKDVGVRRTCRRCHYAGQFNAYPPFIPDIERAISKAHNERLIQEVLPNNSLEFSMNDVESFQTQCRMFYAMQMSDGAQHMCSSMGGEEVEYDSMDELEEMLTSEEFDEEDFSDFSTSSSDESSEEDELEIKVI
jgi:hypothetical protein